MEVIAPWAKLIPVEARWGALRYEREVRKWRKQVQTFFQEFEKRKEKS